MKLTLDMIAKDAAEKALNDIKLDGKTIREWVEIIAKQQLCGDCISREETLNKLNELIAEYIPLMPVGWTLPLNIAKTIKYLPPVIPKGVTVTDFSDRCCECGAEYEKVLEASKPKPGRWIPCDILQEFKCPECRRCFGIKTNFCPNCGADMRVTRESEEGISDAK